MTFPVGHHPGAGWHKADLQCHSPRDRHWEGAEADPIYITDEDREQWAAAFVTECVARGLKAVAITDHHDVCMVDYVRRHVSSIDGCELKVFAGVEITCDDDVQCLAIFDDASTPADWQRLLSKFPKVEPASHTDAKTCAIGPCGWTIAELFLHISDDERLRDICLLIPHFGNAGAHKSLNAERHHTRFVELECDGLYFECPHFEIEDATLKKARGETVEWGTRRRAMIATGDNRRASWERLGAHDCWIKIGEFSTEALRQAFLADEARITHVAPSLPAERIVELRVFSKLTGAEPLTLTFNAGYTAFIGGRGSGKSALLEYMRFALGRADQDFPKNGSAEKPERGREAELLDQTLADGYVEIVLEREGTCETWKRSGANRDRIELRVEGREIEHLTPDAAQRRFRARGFHQKELSTTMNDPTTAADHITGIVAAEALDRRRKIEREIDNAKRKVTTALQKVAAHWQTGFEHAQAKSVVADLAHRIASLNQRLKEEGVRPESLTILEQAPLYGRARNQFTSARAKVAADIQSANKLKESLLRIDFEPVRGAIVLAETVLAAEAIKDAKAQVDQHLSGALQAITSLAEALEAHSRDFEVSSKPFAERLEQATAEQQIHKALIEDLRRLTEEQTEAEAVLSAVAAKALDTLSFAEEFTESLREFDGLIEQKRGILSEAAGLVKSKSSNLDARLKRDKLPREYVAALSAMLEGSTVRDVAVKCPDWVTGVVGQDGGWSKLRSDIIAIYRDKIICGKPQEPGKECMQAIRDFCFAGFTPPTDPQVGRIFSKLDDQIVGGILSAAPRDSISLTYIDESKRKFSFNQASPGQQASALLELLLKQEAGTLVVDQPEDDLDNRVIMRIVNLIKTSKNMRQLIFTTHNANLVVNGDADKILVLRSAVSGDTGEGGPRIEIDVDGAIETPAVCDAITTVMEGGREAFDLRGRKYQFDTSRSF